MTRSADSNWRADTTSAVTMTAQAPAVFDILGTQTSVRETLLVGEQARVGLMGHARQCLGTDRLPRELIGRDANGDPFEGHVHAYFLPVDLDGDGLLEAIVVQVDGGPSDELTETLSTFEWFKDSKGRRVRVALRPHDDALQCPLFAPSAELCSATPFVLPRHPKLRRHRPRRDARGRWVEGPVAQLLREIQNANLPAPEPLIADDVIYGAWVQGHLVPWNEFERRRHRGRGKHGPRTGFGFRLRFDRPIRGPIAVGYGAHFGLGQFHPTSHLGAQDA